MGDEFETFIPTKPAAAHSLDLQQMMLAIVKHPEYSFSISEFWNMPLNLVLQLFGMFEPPAKKAMSRKTLIDGERRWNRKIWQTQSS